VKPQFGSEELRMVAQFVLRSLSDELACRLAKRHGVQNRKGAHDWQMAEKARTLPEKADAAARKAARVFVARSLKRQSCSISINLRPPCRVFGMDHISKYASVLPQNSVCCCYTGKDNFRVQFGVLDLNLDRARAGRQR
jgi:hypothetical protein